MTTLHTGRVGRLTGEYLDGSGSLADPTSPLLDILDPSSTPVVTGAVPVRDTEGFYHYDFAVPADAPLGTWTAHWTGTILGSPVSGDETFTVAAPIPVPPAPPLEPIVNELTPWVADVDLIGEPTLANINLPPGVTLADIAAASTAYLWRAAGGRYDARTVRVRPSRLVPGCGHDLTNPQGWGDWSGWIRGDDRYGLAAVREVALEAPASDITVTVEGVELAPSEWLLVDGYRLVRVGGYWPCCQVLSLPDGGPGTWSILYTAGEPPDALGRLAARELSIELARYHGGQPSKLPAGTTSITRTGISIQLKQPTRKTNGESGTTGLPTVELFLDAVNPGRQRRAPLVLSPDTMVGGRT